MVSICKSHPFLYRILSCRSAYLQWVQRLCVAHAQDLAVVVLLMLIPLLAPSESGAPTGLKTIAKALGIAAVKVT